MCPVQFLQADVRIRRDSAFSLIQPNWIHRPKTKHTGSFLKVTALQLHCGAEGPAPLPTMVLLCKEHNLQRPKVSAWPFCWHWTHRIFLSALRVGFLNTAPPRLVGACYWQLSENICKKKNSIWLYKKPTAMKCFLQALKGTSNFTSFQRATCMVWSTYRSSDNTNTCLPGASLSASPPSRSPQVLQKSWATRDIRNNNKVCERISVAFAR